MKKHILILLAVLILLSAVAMPVFADESPEAEQHINDRLFAWLILLVYILAIPFYFIFAILGSIVALIAIIVSLIGEIVIFLASLFGITLNFAFLLLI